MGDIAESRGSVEIRDKLRSDLQEIDKLSGYGENSGPKEGIWFMNRIVPPLPEMAAAVFKRHLGRRLEVMLEARGS